MKHNLKRSLILAGLTGLICAPSTFAQRLPRSVQAEDKQVLNQQANDLYKVLDPVAAKISPSVVAIKSQNKVIAMGTVTEIGIITKLSEISREGITPRIIDHQGNVHEVVLKSSNKDYDLALLENTAKLPGIKLDDVVNPDIGTFILAPGAANQALASGVISVLPRSLKETDRGFLGVVMQMENEENNGVMLSRVEDKTAASRAGLQAGDTIIKVNDTKINNMLQMRNILQKQKPGDTIIMSYIRDEQVISDVKVTLGARKERPRVRRSRMNSMKRMGGRVNPVAEGFPEVIQSDIQLKSTHCGAPIIDLDGNFVGIAIARSSRIKTYIVEAENITKAFKQ